VATTARGRLDLEAVLLSLYGDGITRVMVEGGPTVSVAFLEAALVDEAVIARGTEALGAGGRKPLGAFGLEVFEDAARWRRVEERAIGADRIFIYRAVGRLPGSEP
jgi:diaminohydroxyphosphoribosylaminopyrimidine deaminase/5-amino-6-(5-phosphoribosylamino)uracil reductase